MKSFTWPLMAFVFFKQLKLLLLFHSPSQLATTWSSCKLFPRKFCAIASTWRFLDPSCSTWKKKERRLQHWLSSCPPSSSIKGPCFQAMKRTRFWELRKKETIGVKFCSFENLSFIIYPFKHPFEIKHESTQPNLTWIKLKQPEILTK